MSNLTPDEQLAISTFCELAARREGCTLTDLMVKVGLYTVADVPTLVEKLKLSSEDLTKLRKLGIEL